MTIRKNIFLLLLLVLQFIQLSAQAPTVFYNQLDLLQGKHKATIPFRYLHNFIVLDATIFGLMHVQFIFDTGAEHVILFKREYTDVLQIPYDKRIPVMGSDLSREIYALITRNGVLEVTGLATKPTDMLVLEENYFNLDEMVGAPIVGLIGGGFFKNLIIRIDYKKRHLTIFDPAYFEPPKDIATLPIYVKTNKPYIEGAASLQDGTVVQVDLLLDTGAGVPLLLHNNSSPSLHLPDEYIRGKLGMGLGGYLEGFIGRISKLSLGEFDFPEVLTSFQDLQPSWLQDNERFRNGIIGNQILNRFDVYLDYNKELLMLKPYRKKPKLFTMDRSGLIIFAYGEDFSQFVVKDIIEHSPAEIADFRSGDIITKIKGIDSKYYTLEAFTQLLQQKAGKKIKIQLTRNNQLIRKELILKDLI
ncbi:MAG: aspartyl protease family protein [Saprospiraceae bacterium]|nr:aspartyl protease family protein [Saprospiraceae bacterium]